MFKTHGSIQFAWQVLVLLSVFNVGCNRGPQVIVMQAPAPAPITVPPVMPPPPDMFPMMADTTGVSGTTPLAADTTGVSTTVDPNQATALAGPVDASFGGWVGYPGTSSGLPQVSYSRTVVERMVTRHTQMQVPGGTLHRYRYNYFRQETTTYRRPLGQPQVYDQIACWPPIPPNPSLPTATATAPAAAPTATASATASATQPGVISVGA